MVESQWKKTKALSGTVYPATHTNKNFPGWKDHRGVSGKCPWRPPSTALWQKQGHHQDRRCSREDSFSQGLKLPQTKHAQLRQPHRSRASGLGKDSAFHTEGNIQGVRFLVKGRLIWNRLEDRNKFNNYVTQPDTLNIWHNKLSQ